MGGLASLLPLVLLVALSSSFQGFEEEVNRKQQPYPVYPEQPYQEYTLQPYQDNQVQPQNQNLKEFHNFFQDHYIASSLIGIGGIAILAMLVQILVTLFNFSTSLGILNRNFDTANENIISTNDLINQINDGAINVLFGSVARGNMATPLGSTTGMIKDGNHQQKRYKNGRNKAKKPNPISLMVRSKRASQLPSWVGLSPYVNNVANSIIQLPTAINGVGTVLSGLGNVLSDIDESLYSLQETVKESADNNKLDFQTLTNTIKDIGDDNINDLAEKVEDADSNTGILMAALTSGLMTGFTNVREDLREISTNILGSQSRQFQANAITRLSNKIECTEECLVTRGEAGVLTDNIAESNVNAERLVEHIGGLNSDAATGRIINGPLQMFRNYQNFPVAQSRKLRNTDYQKKKNHSESAKEENVRNYKNIDQVRKNTQIKINSIDSSKKIVKEKSTSNSIDSSLSSLFDLFIKVKSNLQPTDKLEKKDMDIITDNQINSENSSEPIHKNYTKIVLHDFKSTEDNIQNKENIKRKYHTFDQKGNQNDSINIITKNYTKSLSTPADTILSDIVDKSLPASQNHLLQIPNANMMQKSEIIEGKKELNSSLNDSLEISPGKAVTNTGGLLQKLYNKFLELRNDKEPHCDWGECSDLPDAPKAENMKNVELAIARDNIYYKDKAFSEFDDPLQVTDLLDGDWFDLVPEADFKKGVMYKEPFKYNKTANNFDEEKIVDGKKQPWTSKNLGERANYNKKLVEKNTPELWAIKKLDQMQEITKKMYNLGSFYPTGQKVVPECTEGELTAAVGTCNCGLAGYCFEGETCTFETGGVKATCLPGFRSKSGNAKRRNALIMKLARKRAVGETLLSKSEYKTIVKAYGGGGPGGGGNAVGNNIELLKMVNKNVNDMRRDLLYLWNTQQLTEDAKASMIQATNQHLSSIVFDEYNQNQNVWHMWLSFFLDNVVNYASFGIDLADKIKSWVGGDTKKLLDKLTNVMIDVPVRILEETADVPKELIAGAKESAEPIGAGRKRRSNNELEHDTIKENNLTKQNKLTMQNVTITENNTIIENNTIMENKPTMPNNMTQQGDISSKNNPLRKLQDKSHHQKNYIK